MTRLPTIIPLGLLLSLAAGFHLAAGQVQYVPTPESRVWIEGTSNVTDFTCTTQRLDGHAWMPDVSAGPYAPSTASEPPPRRAPSEDTTLLTVNVAVGTLDCGQRRQNRDLRRAMQADEHPAITYKLIAADLLNEPEAGNGPFKINAIGTLTIAGTSRTVEVTLEAHRQDDGSIVARGHAPLRMTDFDIDPPSAMLGLIRVRDEIEVHFDITAIPASD